MCCYGWLAGKQKEASLTSTPLLAAACGGCSTLSTLYLGWKKHSKKGGNTAACDSIDRSTRIAIAYGGGILLRTCRKLVEQNCFFFTKLS
jgi:hypothetical protein